LVVKESNKRRSQVEFPGRDSIRAAVSPDPREVARGLLFDQEGRLLMVHWRDPVTGHEFLEPPGGQREAGETFKEAVRREIREETGLKEVEVGELVTEIRHRFKFGGNDYDSHERYFACCLAGDATGSTAFDPIEDAGIVGIEWVIVQELIRLPADQVEPQQLLEMLRRLGRLHEGQQQ
jgi:8-oxo-dGTP pyrophosphatase MutT (NUDIX family)